MTCVWLITSFNFYLIQFLINKFEQVYTTAILNSISEILGIISGGIMYNNLRVRGSLFLSYTFAFTGSVLILTYGLHHQESVIFPVLVLIAKFGVSSAFNILYISHVDVFPVLFATTALGICNFISRIFTSMSPVLAQMEEPLPIVIFLGLSMVGSSIVWGI